MAEKPRFTQDYAITITLDPRIREFSTTHQHDIMRYNIENVIKKRIVEAVMSYLDVKPSTLPPIYLTLVAELTKSFDVHYHGIISFPLVYKIRDPAIFLRNVFRERYKGNPAKMESKDFIGFICLKPIDDWTKWTDYITKDIISYKERLNRGSIICDDYELFEADDLLQYKA